MKTFFFAVGQMILFVIFTALYALGNFALLASPSLYIRLSRIHWFVSNPTPDTLHYFIPIGFLMMTAVYLFVFLIEVIAGRVRRAGLWTTVAYLAALVVGAVEHFGWVTRDLR